MKATGFCWRVFVVAAMMAGRSSAQDSGPRTPDIWFTPLTWVVSDVTKHIDYSRHDFAGFLEPGAPWQEASSRISVLTLPGNVVWSYPDRPSLVRFFRHRRFKVAMAFGMLFDDGLCRKGIEGVSQDHDFAHEAVNIARMWKEAGGGMDYVVMDAPLGYGHFLEPTCTHTIDDVARRAVATLKGIRAYFPDIRVVDAEGPARLPDSEWLAMMDTWLAAFKAQAGQPIDAVALDLHWADLRPGNSWQETSRRAAVFLRQRGVKTGLVINDDQHGPAVTDATWMDANRAHIAEVAKGAGLGLDFVTIDSWMGWPRNNLPESDPLAYSSLVNFAFRSFHSVK